MDFKHLEVDLTTGVRPLVSRLRDLLIFTWRYPVLIIYYYSSAGHINDQLSSSVIIFLIWLHQSSKIGDIYSFWHFNITLVTLSSPDIFIDMYQIEYYPLVLLCVLYAEVKPEPANDGFLWTLWLMKYLTWYSSQEENKSQNFVFICGTTFCAESN